MYHAYHGTLLEFRLNHNAIDLASIAKVVAERGLNVVAVTAWQDDGETVLRLVVDDMLRATEVLRGAYFATRERDVVLVDAPQRPGVLKHIATRLANHDIAIRYLCASAGSHQTECVVVVETDDNLRARLLIDAWKLEGSAEQSGQVESSNVAVG